MAAPAESGQLGILRDPAAAALLAAGQKLPGAPPRGGAEGARRLHAALSLAAELARAELEHPPAYISASPQEAAAARAALRALVDAAALCRALAEAASPGPQRAPPQQTPPGPGAGPHSAAVAAARRVRGLEHGGVCIIPLPALHALAVVHRRQQSEFSIGVCTLGEGLTYHAVFPESEPPLCGQMLRRCPLVVSAVPLARAGCGLWWHLAMRPPPGRAALALFYQELLPFLTRTPCRAASMVADAAAWWQHPPEHGDPSLMLSCCAALRYALRCAGATWKMAQWAGTVAPRMHLLRRAASAVRQGALLAPQERSAVLIAARGVARIAAATLEPTEGAHLAVRSELEELTAAAEEAVRPPATAAAAAAAPLAASAELELSAAAAATSFPLWGPLQRADAAAEALAGQPEPPRLRIAPKLCLVPDDPGDSPGGAVPLLRAALDALALLAAQQEALPQSVALRFALCSHVALRCLPIPLRVDHPERDRSCYWRQSVSYSEQQTLLQLVGQLLRHLVAAGLQQRGPHRDADGERVIAAASLLAVTDALCRARPCDAPSLFAEHYGGGPAAGPAGPFCLDACGGLAAATQSLLLRTPELVAARTACSDYFLRLQRNVGEGRTILAFAPAEPQGMRVGSGDLALAAQLSLTLGHPAPDTPLAAALLCGDAPLLTDTYGELVLLRDAAFLVRMLLSPTREALPAATQRWGPADAVLRWRSGKGALSVSGFAGTALDGVCAAPVPAAESPKGALAGLQSALGLRRKRTPRDASPADPTALCGSAVADEADVLALPAVPTFGGALRPSDSELLLCLLTVPYIRIPLVLAFFADRDRTPALAFKEVQGVVDGALFEPGPFQREDAVAPPAYVPAGTRAHLATPCGLLLGELCSNPAPTLAAVGQLLDYTLERDSGGYAAAGTGLALYVLRLASRVEDHLSFLLDRGAARGCRGLPAAGEASAAAAEGRKTLRATLRGPLFRAVCRWCRKALRARDAAAACALHAHAALCFRSASEGEFTVPAVAALLSAQVLTSSFHPWGEDSPAPAWHSFPEAEVLDCFERQRRPLWRWLCAAAAPDRDAVAEAVARVATLTGDVSGSFSKVQKDAQRSWDALGGVLCADSGPAPAAAAEDVQGEGFEAWLRRRCGGSGTPSIDLNTGEYSPGGGRGDLRRLPRALAESPDLPAAVGQEQRPGLHCSEVSRAPRRLCVRLVGADCDAHIWDADDRPMHVEAGEPYDAAVAELNGLGWVPEVLEPLRAEVRALKQMELFLPVNAAAVASAPFVVLTGVYQDARGRQLKRVVVWSNPPCVHVFDVVEHGRRLYHRQRFTSDAVWSLHTPHAGSSEADATQEQRPLRYGAEWTLCCGSAALVTPPGPSVVLLRTRSRGAGSLQYLPPRLLLGLMPDALLDGYQFWQSVTTSALAGIPRRDDTGYRLEVELQPSDGDASATIRRIPIAGGGAPQRLVNLLDSRARVLSAVLRRLDNLSHVLCWADDDRVAAVELPRLGLSFVANSEGELCCVQHSGLALAGRHAVEGLLALFGGGTLLLRHTATGELHVAASAGAEPMLPGDQGALLTAVGARVISARRLRAADGGWIEAAAAGTVQGHGLRVGNVVVRFDNGSSADAVPGVDVAPAPDESRDGEDAPGGPTSPSGRSAGGSPLPRPGPAVVIASTSPVAPIPSPADAAVTDVERAALVESMVPPGLGKEAATAHREVLQGVVADMPARTVRERLLGGAAVRLPLPEPPRPQPAVAAVPAVSAPVADRGAEGSGPAPRRLALCVAEGKRLRRSWLEQLQGGRLLFRRGEPGWVSAGGAGHYLFPIHPSGAFVSTPTLAAALYRGLCLALTGAHKELRALADSLADCATVTERQLWGRLTLALSRDPSPDAAACRLRLSVAMAPYGEAVPVPWDTRAELAAYVRLRGIVSAAVALPIEDELRLLEQHGPWDSEAAVENRLRSLRAAECVAAFDAARAGGGAEESSGDEGKDTCDSKDEVTFLYGETWEMPRQGYDVVSCQLAAEPLHPDWADEAGAALAYARPRAQAMEGPDAAMYVDGLLAEGGPPFLLCYEVLTGSVRVDLGGGDDWHAVGGLLARLYCASSTTGVLSNLLRAIDLNLAALAGALPRFSDGDEMGKVGKAVAGLFKSTASAQRLVAAACAVLRDRRRGLVFLPQGPAAPYVPPGRLRAPSIRDRRWASLPLTADVGRELYTTSPPRDFDFPMRPLAEGALTDAPPRAAPAGAEQLHAALLALPAAPAAAELRARFAADVQFHAAAPNTAKALAPSAAEAGALRALERGAGELAERETAAAAAARQRAVDAANKTDPCSWLAQFGGSVPPIDAVQVVSALLSQEGDSALQRINPEARVGEVWQAAVEWLAATCRAGHAVRCARAASELAAAMAAGAAPLAVRLRSDALAELLAARRHYAPTEGPCSFDPRLLCFEFLCGLLLRRQQVGLLRAFLDTAQRDRSMCHQMLMGEGKTTVVAPLLALVLADGRRLVSAVMPRTLVAFSRAVLRERFGNPVAPRVVLTLAFDRSTRASEQLLRKLDSAVKRRAVVVAPPQALKSVLLKVIELCEALDVDRRQARAEQREAEGLEGMAKVRKALGIARAARPGLQQRPRADVEGELVTAKRLLHLLQCGAVLLDEVDLLMHPLKSELNWPLGRRQPLDLAAPAGDGDGARDEGPRYQLPWLLLELVHTASDAPGAEVTQFAESAVTQHTLAQLREALEKALESCDVQAVPHLALLNPEVYRSTMLPPLCEWAAMWLRHHRAAVELTGDEVLEILAARGSELSHQLDERVRRVCRDRDLQLINLASEWLHTLLPHVLSRVHRVSYGVLRPAELARAVAADPTMPRSRRFLAVPFVGKDTPSASSEFQSPDVVAGFTARAYMLDGMRRGDVLRLLRAAKAAVRAEHGRPHFQRAACRAYVDWVRRAGGRVRGYSWDGVFLFGRADPSEPPRDRRRRLPPLRDSDREPLEADADEEDQLATVPPLQVLDLSDSDQVDFMCRLLRRSAAATRHYLFREVFPATLDKAQAQLTASAQELGGPQLGAVRLGFSGTPNDLLPMAMGGCRYAAGDDGRMLSTLSRSDVVSVRHLPPGWTVGSLLQTVAEGPYTALIDCGALVTGITNAEVAAQLLALGLCGFGGVVFLDAEGERMVLTRDGLRVLRLEQCGLATEQRFTYYDHAHTTGIDIKQPIQCAACMTLGKDVVWRDAAQGAYRMRGVGVGQTIDLLLPPEVAQKVQRCGGNDAAAVVRWLVKRALAETPPLRRLLCMQNAGSLWGSAALAALQRAPPGSDKAGDALQALKTPVVFDISNALGGDSAAVEADPVGLLRRLQGQHTAWISGSAGELLDSIAVELGNLAASQFRVDLEREQVQEQEQEQEEEQEQEVEQEQEQEHEQHQQPEAELVPERALPQKYCRDDMRTIGWPVGRLREGEETGEEPPPFFYPLSEFAVFRGVGRQSSEPLAFPGCMLVSENYYRRQWRFRSVRRLRSAVAYIEWVPAPSRLAPELPAAPLEETELLELRESFALFADSTLAEPVVPPHSVAALMRALVPSVLADDHAAEAAAAALAPPAAGKQPGVSCAAVEAAVLAQRRAHAEGGRVWVLITLDEAEHLRAALPVLAGAHVALRALPMRGLRGAPALAAAPGFAPQPSGHPLAQEAEACVRLCDADCGAWTEPELAAARHALRKADPELRRRWFLDVRSCKRRSTRAWAQLGAAPLFVAEDQRQQLAARALVSRAKLVMVAERLWPTDLFRMIDASGQGTIAARRLRDGLERMGLSGVTEQAAELIVKTNAAAPAEGLTLDEFRAAFSVDDPERDGIPEHLAQALIAARAGDEAARQSGGATAASLPPPPPLLPTGGRFEVATERVRRFRVVWTSRGTLCDAPLALWAADLPRPRAAREWLPVGHYGRPHFRHPDPAKDEEPALCICITDRRPGADGEPTLAEWVDAVLPRPAGFRLVWTLRAGATPLFVWRPVPPSAEWVPLGDIATTVQVEPPPREARCFPASWGVPARSLSQGLPLRIWADSGAAARAQGCWVANCCGGLQFLPAGDVCSALSPRPGRYSADALSPERDSDSSDASEDAAEQAAAVVPMVISGARVSERQSLQGQVYYAVDVTHACPRPGQPDQWRLWKSYNNFVDLRARVVQRGFDGPFPKRILLRPTDSELDERRAGLDVFLQQIVEQAKMPRGWALRPLVTDFATDQGAYCAGALCVVCGRSDRPGIQRKSGFKCNGCKHKKHRKLADPTRPGGS